MVDGVNPMRSLSYALTSATRSQPRLSAEARTAWTSSSSVSVTETPSGPRAPRTSEAPRLWSSIDR
jgi:hypothetical protein